MELLVHDSPETVAEAVADRIAGLIAEADDRFSLGLSGGTTPEDTYRALWARAPRWDRVDAWLSDERWVPPDHERSNGALVARALFDDADVSFDRPRWSEFLTPADSAAHYEARLRHIHRESGPDLVLLGMGEDGHTASLFPGTPALQVQDRWYVANPVPQLGEQRLTATFPLLWGARLLMVLVVGVGKAQAVRSSFEKATPAGLLGEGGAEVEWHVDRDAASLIA
ncbi:MAG TPA: 6-phosphogluconolactonase [Acidimicrobiia bacterium]|jgi:6-phosphogluconolactonase